MTDLTQVVKDGLDAVSAKFDREILRLNDEITDLSQKSAGGGMLQQKRADAVAAIIGKSADVEAMRLRKSKAAIVPLSDVSIPMLRKAITGDAGAEVFAVQPQRWSGIANDARRRLSVVDMLQRISVNSNSFEYIALDGFTNASAYQLTEGSEKAAQTVPTELLTANIATIAAVMTASEQVLADVPVLTQYLNSKLMYGVMEKLEAEVINGVGGSGKISGLITQATTFAASAGSEGPDAIAEAIAQLDVNGWNPGAIVLHPATWAVYRSMREDAGSGAYLAGGWSNPAEPSMWNLPVITNAACPTTTALVIDPAQVALLDRMSARVEMGWTGDQFAQNLISLRGELRAGLVVFAPSAVLKLTV
jgi:HK97 family phage major capsid protein